MTRMLSPDEASVLRMILFRRGLRPGASLDELEKVCQAPLEDVIAGLKEQLGQLGLEIVVVDETEGFMSEGRKRAFVRSREPLRREDLKMCGWDRRSLAALAVTSAYLASRGGRAKELELVNILGTKKISPRRIDRMVEAGYLARDGEMIGLSWRALAEIDQEKLKRLFLAARARSGPDRQEPA